jgi:hypothetical protein
MTGKPRNRPPKNTEKQSEITGARKAFRTTKPKMPDIVGLSSNTYTETYTLFTFIGNKANKTKPFSL